MLSPYEETLETIYIILKYMKSNPRDVLFFKRTSERIVFIFTDVDCAWLVIYQRSTSGNCTYV